MATPLDQKIPPKVAALIAVHGVTATFMPNDGTYVPETGDVGADQTGPFTAKVSPPQPITRYATGAVLHEAAAKVVLPAQDLGFTPAVGWTVAIGGKAWEVVGVVDLRTGDSVAGYELELAR